MNNYLDKLFTNFWSDLVRVSHDGKHPFRYPSLATYNSEVGVSQRTVVLRKVFPYEKELLFFSDIRTQKVYDISLDNQTSVLFYHPKQRTQFRLNCNIKIIKDGVEKENYWKNINDGQKKDYASLLEPGSKVISKKDILYYEDVEEGERNFCLLKGNVTSIDYLQLNKIQHERVLFQKDEKGLWNAELLIP